jgi:hypothetical protein
MQSKMINRAVAGAGQQELRPSAQNTWGADLGLVGMPYFLIKNMINYEKGALKQKRLRMDQRKISLRD